MGFSGILNKTKISIMRMRERSLCYKKLPGGSNDAIFSKFILFINLPNVLRVLTRNKTRRIARRKGYSALTSHCKNHNVVLFNIIYIRNY